MKVYIVQTKVFYKVDSIDYQVADALQPLTVVSSKTKAYKALDDYENYYKERGFKRNSKYNNLFPTEHFTMTNNHYRVVIYFLESEVE